MFYYRFVIDVFGGDVHHREIERALGWANVAGSDFVDMDGNILWETVYGHAWDQSYPETRNTPTIEDGRIYIMGGLGTVVCMDTEKGEFIWKVNTHQEYEGEFIILLN